MDAMSATNLAECLELDLGASAPEGCVACFAVPLRPGSTRRKTRWAFLVVTDLPERTVREVLSRFHVDLVERRGSRRVFAAWPQGRDHTTL